MVGSEEQGAKQMDIEGNHQMDMDNNDNDGEHKTETDRAEMTDGHETGDSTTLGSRHSLGGRTVPLCLHWFQIARMERL
jgi:hypothetical protein